MMMHFHMPATRFWTLLLLLPLAAGTTIPAAQGIQNEPDEALNPAALIARIMSAGSESDDVVERLRPEDVMQRLWRNRISGPRPQEDAQTQGELEEIIRKVRSVRFETGKPSDTARGPVRPVQDMYGGIASQEVGSALHTSNFKHGTSPAPATRALPAEAGEALGRLLSNPDIVRDPLEMAEVLFLSGRPAEAAVLYRKALDLAVGDSLTAREDRAWILLQLGTCLRQTDVTQARSTYARLIADYPQSPWTELAKAHHQLLLWQERVQLDQLIVRPEAQPAGQMHVAQGLR